MDLLGLKVLSRKLLSSCIFSFLNSLYLVFYQQNMPVRCYGSK
jgi:hypothetical protein